MHQSTGQGFSPQQSGQGHEQQSSSPETTSSGPCQPPPRKRIDASCTSISAFTAPIKDSGVEPPVPPDPPLNVPPGVPINPIHSSSDSDESSDSAPTTNEKLKKSGSRASKLIDGCTGDTPDYNNVPTEEDPVQEFARASAAFVAPMGYDQGSDEPIPTSGDDKVGNESKSVGAPGWTKLAELMAEAKSKLTSQVPNIASPPKQPSNSGAAASGSGANLIRTPSSCVASGNQETERKLHDEIKTQKLRVHELEEQLRLQKIANDKSAQKVEELQAERSKLQ